MTGDLKKYESERPGFMVYHDDLRELCSDYSNEEIGMLLRAWLDYSERGVYTEFKSRDLKAQYKKQLPKIDKNSEEYIKKRVDSQYALYCKYNKNVETLSKEEWYKREFQKENQSTPVYDGIRPNTTVYDSMHPLCGGLPNIKETITIDETENRTLNEKETKNKTIYENSNTENPRGSPGGISLQKQNELLNAIHAVPIPPGGYGSLYG